MKDRLVRQVGHYWVLFYIYSTARVDYRIVNTNNGIENKKKFSTPEKAIAHAKRLLGWHNVNKSPNGKRRTAKFNKKTVAKYHRIKVQPKDWKDGVNGPN